MYVRKQREGVACTVLSPKGIPHTQLVRTSVYHSSIEQPSTHIIMYVLVLTMHACLQGGTDDFGHVSRIKQWLSQK